MRFVSFYSLFGWNGKFGVREGAGYSGALLPGWTLSYTAADHALNRGVALKFGATSKDVLNRSFETMALLRLTRMRPPLVKRQTAPESGFLHFFPRDEARRRRSSVSCSGVISVHRCQPT